MNRQILLSGVHFKLMLALLIGFISLGAPAVGPIPAAAQSEEPGVCDLFSGDHIMIQQGAQGGAVFHAQCLLNEYYKFDIAQDGLFDRQTAGAVSALQRLFGHKVDGIIGECTWAALHTAPPPAGCQT